MTFVSPINTITIDCSGNILPNAILLADVDANTSNELLIGTQEGELLIFKAGRNQTSAQLWRRVHGLGFITAVTVGLLTTNSIEPRPTICVANAEGAIHLFLLRSSAQRNRVRSAGGIMNSGNRNDSKLQLHNSSTAIVSNDEEQQKLEVAFSQQLICNPKVLLIQDYNENDKQLIIAYCDRTIRVFNSMIMEEHDGRLSGRFVLKNVFNIPDEIHTLTSQQMLNKDFELIVSQPAGNLIRFNPNDENGRMLATDMCSYRTTGWTEAIALDKFFDEPAYATIYHDRIDIFNSQLNKILNTIPLSVKTGYLCGLRKGPLTKDNYNQLVTISSADGDTFLVDRQTNITRFRPPLPTNTGCVSSTDSMTNTGFSDQIQTFTCGSFGDNNMFCFIYVLTHNEKIVIVHSLELTNTKTTNLLATLTNRTADDQLKQVGSTPDKLKDLLHPRS